MHRFAAMLSLTLAACAASPGPAGQPSPARWFEAATLPDFDHLELAQRPTVEQTAHALPAAAKVPFRLWFECEAKADGALAGCHATRLWPNDATTERAGRALLRYFRLTPAATALAQRSEGKVNLALFITDEARELDQSCPSGWCSITPPPPPVPPRPAG